MGEEENETEAPRSTIYTPAKIDSEYNWMKEEAPEVFHEDASEEEKRKTLFYVFTERGHTLQAAEFLTGRMWYEWDDADKQRLREVLTDEQKDLIPAHMRQKLGI